MTWGPATPAEVTELFAGYEPLVDRGRTCDRTRRGQAFREHGDIDVLLMRRDQLVVQHALAGWEWWAADPPGVLRPWLPGEVLEVVHDIWCRPSSGSPWRIQVMLDESDGDEWVSKRNPRLRRPVAEIGRGDIPCLVPDIQLFYKAKARREKDDLDFEKALPLLDTDQRRWLRDAITDTYGDHPWVYGMARREQLS